MASETTPVPVVGRQLRKSTLLSRIQEQKEISVKEKPQRNEKGRRSLFKLKRPVKSPKFGATTHVTRAVTHKGQLFTIGDIVALDSNEDGIVYYGQITGLLSDPYGEKSASLAWLVPTGFSTGVFDPATWIFGESDDRPRKLDKLRYVQHVSPDYFKSDIVRI